jgi:hypothetical protein
MPRGGKRLQTELVRELAFKNKEEVVALTSKRFENSKDLFLAELTSAPKPGAESTAWT